MSSDPIQEIETGLLAVGDEYRQRFAAAQTEHDLRNVRADILGKKGALTRVLRAMGAVPADRKREMGERVNAARAEVEAAFDKRLSEIRKALRDAELNATPFDLSLPGRSPAPRGHRHPISLVREEILDIFRSLGFEVAWGPEVELEANNFTKLAFPPDHPATDLQDTFWVSVLGGSPNARVLLRTQTSTVQIREMSRHAPPLAIVSGGSVYRRDDDVTHSPMFHQIEGFLVNEQVSFAELKGVLTQFCPSALRRA